tara:strand:- start:156 stop:527 length:372 start_codon:yes stop_codon:yes gene_type:complete
MNITKYLWNFILGGSATILVNYLLENFEDGPALTAYIYVAPTIYLVVMYLTYRDRGFQGYYSFLVHSFINSMFFLFTLYILLLLTKYTYFNVFINFAISTLIFVLYSIYYFKYIFKMKFEIKN